jgi:hypothetical protein
MFPKKIVNAFYNRLLRHKRLLKENETLKNEIASTFRGGDKYNSFTLITSSYKEIVVDRLMCIYYTMITTNKPD